MKRLIILGALLISISANAQVAKDSVYLLIRSLISPATNVVRTANLDSAAAFHARYLISNKTSGHLEPDSPTTYTPMRRAEKFGDWGIGVYEVCWTGNPDYNLPTSIKGSIDLFKISEKHWYIMTEGVSDQSKVRFGYSFIQGKDWVACVIIYSVGPQVKYNY